MRTGTPKIGGGALAPLLAMLLICVAVGSGCLPKSDTSTGTGRTITVYGFSIMKEALEKSIFPAFAAKWKQEHGEDVKFVSSFAGSETITNQILSGVAADVAILSIERDVDRLQQAGLVPAAWHDLPNRGVVNKTPFLILVRKGNPKGIHDFADLAKPGVQLIHPDPVSSGGAQWSLLALYGSELIKSEKETGKRDEARALQLLRGVWKNVISTPGSAREARTNFETGYGDALVTYEIDALLMKKAGGAVEIVIPEATIYSEHPAVMIEKNVKNDQRPVVTAFLQYLWSEEAQRAFVQNHFRAASDEALNAANPEFANIKTAFTIADLGGWAKAYPDIIEHIFRDQVQRSK
jgi:sulfate transport system substrate-binding protein